MNVNFTTLFERSRYSNRGRRFGLSEDELAQKQRMEQQERFAVSVIGFELERDVEFRAHFLDKICGLNDLSRAAGWDVSVEPRTWGDLVLKHRASNSLLVAEFKIGAELRPHQNPANVLFNSPAKDSQPAGYGWEISEISRVEKWDYSRYVTVEKAKSWLASVNGRLMCVPGEWRQLLRPDLSSESQLEADGYDCLADFGVSAFAGRRLGNMKLGNNATKGLNLLISVFEDRVNFKPKYLEAGKDYVGINLHREDFPEIARLSSSDRVVGWFGYECTDLSFWIYGATEHAEKVLADAETQKLGTVQQNELGNNSVDRGLRCSWGGSPGDREWFTKVLNAAEGSQK